MNPTISRDANLYPHTNASFNLSQQLCCHTWSLQLVVFTHFFVSNKKNTSNHQIIFNCITMYSSPGVCNQQAVTGIWLGKNVMSSVPPCPATCVCHAVAVGGLPWLVGTCLRAGLARWDKVCRAMVPWCSSWSRQTRAGALVGAWQQQMVTWKTYG